MGATEKARPHPWSVTLERALGFSASAAGLLGRGDDFGTLLVALDAVTDSLDGLVDIVARLGASQTHAITSFEVS